MLATILLAAVGAASAPAASTFKPRVGSALGIEPTYTSPDIALGTNIPAAYHGGSVMRDVTVHTVFWAPPGYHFDGSPGAGTLGYAALIQQFFTDVAHDSGTTSNVFSLLDQYGDRSGDGAYNIHYDARTDSVTDTDPYPSSASQCSSPSGVATCVTDFELQRELDKLIGTGGSGSAGGSGSRGLSNVWFILLPPDVDTCSEAGTCATNAFAGYHSAFDLGHGETVYASIPDPLVEFTPPPGSDPDGNPEAEATVQTLAHEAVEAITDPLGTAWMDPNGFETADKCENGPQQGPPLGYSADGAPYNQLIDGHPYLIQDIWSNARSGCVQSSTTVASIPPLHSVTLRQFSSRVSGAIGADRRLPVTVVLTRAGLPVALGNGESRANGSWGPLTLRGRNGQPHAVGDDRDAIEILYGLGRTSPRPDLIQTGDGGNPFTESGWTGWFDLDHGYAVHSGRRSQTTILLGPCGQTGVLSLEIGATFTTSPVDLCSTEADASVINVRHVGAGTPVTMTSEDNRGEYLLAPNGALVTMTVALGEPDSVPAVGNRQLLFGPTGFPTCTAFLRIRTVRCTGLVSRAAYRLRLRGRAIAHGAAGSAGAVTFAGVAVREGDVVTLVNAAGRALSTLHVAHLQVRIIGNETTIASGTCQGGDYWGKSLTTPPTGAEIGMGPAGSGTICPSSGQAKGLPTADIAQTDDFSGGQTETQVAEIESTAPIQDETLYGGFIASAQSGLPGPHGSVSAAGVPIALNISAAGSPHRIVFHATNVDRRRGVAVDALPPGAYVASWVLHDAAGDTRIVTTRFVDEP
ncbi:MAG TPA: hypothetical protein VIK04_05250 [Solirubrobacteraceae bacterium]